MFLESKDIYPEKAAKPVKKLKKIAERLHPNPKVTVYEKDPTFEMKYVFQTNFYLLFLLSKTLNWIVLSV